MNIEEMQKEENFEHEVIDRLKCLDMMDFDFNVVDSSYVDALLKARDIILTAYEKEKEKNKELVAKVEILESQNIKLCDDNLELIKSSPYNKNLHYKYVETQEIEPRWYKKEGNKQ